MSNFKYPNHSNSCYITTDKISAALHIMEAASVLLRDAAPYVSEGAKRTIRDVYSNLKSGYDSLNDLWFNCATEMGYAFDQAPDLDGIEPESGAGVYVNNIVNSAD